jgi:hypothetical protein
MASAVDMPNTNVLRTAARATIAAAPLAIAPTCVLVFGSEWPNWQRMVGVALAVFFAAKWLSFADFLWSEGAAHARDLQRARVAGYFFFWPGMDPRPFFATSPMVARPRTSEWLLAATTFCVGVALVGGAAHYAGTEPFFAGWVGIAGFLLALHFGSFHLMSLVWRSGGVNAMPIMNAPFASTSLADFWGRRWNLAFRDLAHRFVFRPTRVPFGPATAMLLVFLMSGLAHDAVVSLPVHGGYGGPTLYFLIQAGGMLFERTTFARRRGLGRGVAGWAFAMLVVFGPAPLLFHRPFVERAIVPMLEALPL